MGPKTKLDLQFDTNRKTRAGAIKRRIGDTIGTVSQIKYCSQPGYYKSTDNSTEFPFIFEFAVIQTEMDDGHKEKYNLNYLNAINSSPHRRRSFLIGNKADTFSWYNSRRSGSGNDDDVKKVNTASSIFQMMEIYGFSHNSEKCKKPNSIVFANLISPRINYESYGKFKIDLKPFANTIAETVYKVCSSYSSSFRKDGYGNNINEYGERISVRSLLKELLKERLQNIEKDPSLKDRDRWTQSTVFYRLRPKLLEALGYSAEDIGKKRQYITSMIRQICQELDTKREELGIFAADRAQLYFKGRWHDVGFDDLERLMHMGTDLIIIEKEGVAEVLAPFADRKGIALLNTRGFLTEYATMLSDLASKNGCNISIVSDFDVSGMYIAKKMKNLVYRIGVDFNTLEYFGLDVEDLAEKYVANSNHLKPLQEIAKSDATLDNDLKFLKDKRIEIDSIIADVGSEEFWEFIAHRLGEKFAKRNYNRAIDIAEFVYPDIVKDMLEKLEKKFAAAAAQERNQIKNELLNVSDFLDIEGKECEIKLRLKNKITGDKSIQTLLEKVKELVSIINDGYV